MLIERASQRKQNQQSEPLLPSGQKTATVRAWTESKNQMVVMMVMVIGLTCTPTPSSI